MRYISVFTMLIMLACCWETLALDGPPAAQDTERISIVGIATLEQQARARVNAKPRVPLAPADSDVFKEIDSLEPTGTGRTPNYLRALAALPGAVKPFAHLMKVAIYKGAITPEVKMGMGLRIAQMHASPYVGAHMQRLLAASEHGKMLLGCMKKGDEGAMSQADRLALDYAEALTRDVNGVSRESFASLRSAYNDSQIVELTMTVCLFNYLTRFCEAARLPVESWAVDGSAFRPQVAVKYEPPAARVALITDEEMKAVSDIAQAAKDPARQTLGLGIANSQRAMMRSPEFALAWRAYGSAVREYASVTRELKLHISFAVSMVNGCRYCVLHQVLGLRRLNVDPAKLMAMKKDDKALSPRELIAVQFARKLTKEPGSITDGDYEKLRAEFTEQGALEALLQTCAFNFMNRFTDGLRLPSEDEAIRVYKEVYGSN